MTFLFWFAATVGVVWGAYDLVKAWTTPDRFKDVDRLAKENR